MTSRDKQRFPQVTKTLMDHLQERFPNQLPTNPDFTYGDVREDVGTQKVIRWLKELYERQNE